MQSNTVSTVITISLFAGLASGFLYLIIAGYRWVRIQNKRCGVWLFKDHRENFQLTVAGFNRKGKTESEVREAIEKFIEGILGGTLDEVQVSKMFLHPSYDDLISKYEEKLSTLLSRLTASLHLISDGGPGIPDKILLQLKGLLRDISSEANQLPLFQRISVISNFDDLEMKSYEDILAIAILNKIVLNCQTHSSNFNENGNVVKNSDLNDSGDELSETLDDWQEDDNWSTSTDPLIFSDLLLDASNHFVEEEDTENDILALKLLFNKKTTFPEYGVDIVEGKGDHPTFERNLSVDTWEDNWLFKKKKLKHGLSTSVSMLVPSPSDFVKAFIGGEDAEQTSDFSDCSDSQLEEVINSKSDEDILWIPVGSKSSAESVRSDTRTRGVEKENDSGIFEEAVLRNSLTNLAYRGKGGSSQHFTMNPLFYDDCCYTTKSFIDQHYTSLQYPKKKNKYTKISNFGDPEISRKILHPLSDIRLARSNPSKM